MKLISTIQLIHLENDYTYTNSLNILHGNTMQLNPTEYTGKYNNVQRPNSDYYFSSQVPTHFIKAYEMHVFWGKKIKTLPFFWWTFIPTSTFLNCHVGHDVGIWRANCALRWHLMWQLETVLMYWDVSANQWHEEPKSDDKIMQILSCPTFTVRWQASQKRYCTAFYHLNVYTVLYCTV